MTRMIDETESELLGLLRGDDVPEFNLVISYKDGRWFVSVKLPSESAPGTGEGETFHEAWRQIEPWWSDKP